MEHKKKAEKVIPPLPQINTFPIITDPQGSYTGLSEERWETPVQDVDDL